MVSRRLQRHGRGAAPTASFIDQARLELYRGQCNCSYWHGAFGGIYLPHLRNAVYQPPDRRRQPARSARPSGSDQQPWVEATADDLQPRRPPGSAAGQRPAVALFAPAQGGQLYELDVQSICHNLLATLARRPEAYHRKVLARPVDRQAATSPAFTTASSSSRQARPAAAVRPLAAQEPGRPLLSRPTSTSRRSPRGRGRGAGRFRRTALYEAKLRRSDGRVQVQLTREGSVQGRDGAAHQGRHARTPASATLEIAYLLENVPADIGAALGAGVQLRRPALGRRRPLLHRRPGPAARPARPPARSAAA